MAGFAERARVKAEWLVRLPEGISTAQAMAIGTAGYTAMLACWRSRRRGSGRTAAMCWSPGRRAGWAAWRSRCWIGLGYRVIASSRRAAEEGEYLRQLGADEVIDAGTLSAPGRPLGEGALGGGDRRGRQPHAGQRAGGDAL